MARAGVWVLFLFCAGTLGAEPLPGYPPEPEKVLSAFQQEMDRSLAKLHLEQFGPPYFMAYRMVADRTVSLRAYFGEINLRSSQQRYALYVEARYGKPALDNVDDDYNGPSAFAPVDPNPEALRQQLWELTDEAYKKALVGYLGKKARLAEELDTDNLVDFSTGPVVQVFEPPPLSDVPSHELEGLLRRVSGVFRQYAPLEKGEAAITYDWATRYLLTSEGTRIVTEDETLPVDVYVGAHVRAGDGMDLEQFKTWSVRDLQHLPSEKELVKAAETVSQNLLSLQKSEAQPPATAPAILDPEFTGVFFHEAIGHKLEGQRQRDPEESQVFKGRLGQQVMPAFLSLIDDPSLESFEGVPLNGHYKYDSEGTPSQRVVLIDHGILRNFLTSRRPVPGLSTSNGHGRADEWHHPIGRMGTLILEASDTVPVSELKRRLMRMCRDRGKAYGFWLKGAVGGDNPTQKEAPQTLRVQPKLVYRIDAKTGRETLVRGVEFVGTPLVDVNKIVAAGDDRGLDNAGSCGAASGWIPVAEIAPSVLLSEIELQRLPEERERPPVLPSPLHLP